MYPRLDGELAKLVQVENGFNVVVWDPEMPKPVIGVNTPPASPCAQQPVKFWKTYSFPTAPEAIAFLGRFVEALGD